MSGSRGTIGAIAPLNHTKATLFTRIFYISENNIRVISRHTIFFRQKVFVRFYFLVKITRGKVSVNFTGDENFHFPLL